MAISEERIRVSAKNAEHATVTRPADRGTKSHKLTLREHITLFGCAVLVVGSLVVDAIREWRR